MGLGVSSGGRLPLAGRHVGVAAAGLGALLTAGSGGYGYHRDELYFRMLPAAWGYIDQPPLSPFLARVTRDLIADEPWALRLPATLSAMLTVLVVTLLTRELGGGRGAQALSAYGFGFSAAALMFGHLLLTSTLDLLLWSSIALAAVCAVRREPRWWLVVGALAGLATYNRWLVAVLCAGIALGLLVTGSRRGLRSPWLWAGALTALAVSLPNLAYQATHGWPQLAMGSALAENNAGQVRVEMWLLLVILLGPPLLPVWVAGLVTLLRDPGWRDVRFLAVTFAVLVVFTFGVAAQPHYTLGGLVILYAAGCVPTARWLAHRSAWRRIAVAGVALNAMVSVLLGLPVVPLGSVGATPVPAVSQLVADQVGWPEYVRQVATVYRSLDAGPEVAVIASNYGEAGAIDRFGPALGLPHPYSGQNQLWDEGRPGDAVSTVVLVGGQVEAARAWFADCEVRDRLDNGVEVDNEEQGVPVAICREPRAPWGTLWARFRHLD